MLHTDPEGATVLVLPAKQGAKPFQCVAPCSVQVPQQWGFQLIATKDGYKMVGPQPPVAWVERKGQWWQGNGVRPATEHRDAEAGAGRWWSRPLNARIPSAPV